MFRPAKILILAFVVAGALVHADCGNTKIDFQIQAPTIPIALAKKGYVSFGGLQLLPFVNSMSAVEIEPTTWFERPEPTTSSLKTARSTAKWERSARGFKISVNCDLWNQTQTSARRVIGIHEHLGPAGFNDHKYQISTKLWLLSLPEADQILHDDEKAAIASRLQVEANAGGVTAVGGGGDTAGVATKLGLIKMDLLKMRRLTDPEARRAALTNLILDFQITEEVRRDANGIQIETYSEHSVAKGEEIEKYKVCTYFLARPGQRQQQMYKALLANDDGRMATRFPNFEALIEYCHQATTGLP